MSTKSLERVFTLLMVVLMITTAFIPAVSAMAPTTAASNTETSGHSFSGTMPSAAATSTAASATVSNGQSAAKNKKNQSLWSPENWAQPMSGTNATGYSPMEADYVEEPGMDVSQETGVERVVTGSGKTKIKVHDPETRTIRIRDASKSASKGGDDELEIRLVNATPDLGTFTEIFEITAHRTIALDESEDFRATWALHNGNENITRAEWFVWENQSHTVEIPIIEYRNVTFETGALEEIDLETGTPESIVPDSSPSDNNYFENGTFEDITTGNVAHEAITSENATFENGIREEITPESNSSENSTFEDISVEDVIPESDIFRNATPNETTPGTVTVREPYIAGTETVEQYWPEWVPYTPEGQALSAGETRLFKVIYSKPAEIGQVDINTAPVFRGVKCSEMTWWSIAWTTRVPITVTNPTSIDGYPHREVVSFRDGMQSDFDDVRFAAEDGTVLDYWKESYTASDSAVIWVNLPAGATTIWMYYGNAAATDIGDRNNVYILYDDFDGPWLDTTLWTDTTPGAHHFSDGWIYDTRYSGAGVLVSNDNVITDGEPVIVETHVHAIGLPSNPGYCCGYLPLFADTVSNGLLWYPDSTPWGTNWDRYVFVNGGASWRPGASRGLSTGGDYYSTWIITPSSQTHTVSGSASYTDVFSGTTGISNHRMYILGGDNTPSGRIMRMDWIRVRKYVETEPAFGYGTPQENPIIAKITVTPPYEELMVGGTCQLSATAFDSNGTILPVGDNILTWASSDETVGTVNADGIFTALSDGTTVVTASRGSVRGVAVVSVTHIGASALTWTWSDDGWDGWSHTASWTNPIGSCSEYGPVTVDNHGEHGADVHLSAGAVIASVERNFTDPSGTGWNGLTLVARVPGSDVPSGRWMTVEVNGEVVYSESDFSGSDPANRIPEVSHIAFPQSDTVQVNISHGQNPAYGVRFPMEYYSLKLYSPPPITITSPLDDVVPSGGNITVAGNVSDIGITNLTLTHNGVPSTITVQDGNFSAEVTLADANNITVSVSDFMGNSVSKTLLLDGDMLAAEFEEAIGFDPLDADSNCINQTGDQADNGIIDGYEVFDGKLPVFAKCRIGANPFINDTDYDGLTDDFELLKLGVFPGESGTVSIMGGDGVYALEAGTDDDPDGDGLSNVDEMNNETDPLKADTDDDGLSDLDEINGVYGAVTDPCIADTDDDGLLDGYEVILGTGLLNNDTNINGTLDGAEYYWSGDRFVNDTLDLTVHGRGYAIANVSVTEVNYTHLISDDVLVSKVYDIGFGDGVDYGTVEIAYEPTLVEPSAILSIYRFDEDLGTFVQVSSVVDSGNYTVSCNATGSAKYAVLDSLDWDALFDDSMVEIQSYEDRGHVRLHVMDSTTHESVAGAHVVVNDPLDQRANTTADGHTYYFTFDPEEISSDGRVSYELFRDEYNNYVGNILITPDDIGLTRTDDAYINPISAPTGSVIISSVPNPTLIYVDGVYRGNAPFVLNDVLAGNRTIEARKAGYIPDTKTVYVPDGGAAYAYFYPVYSGESGSIVVNSSPPGADVSIDYVWVGTTSQDTGIYTRNSVTVGMHQVEVTKEGYLPYSERVHVANGNTTYVNASLDLADDGDGLNATYESGYRDGFGNWHVTDPNLIDTDGDGLTDGEEAGYPVTDEYGRTYFKQLSDPTKPDTDGDGLGDMAERDHGSDAFNPSTSLIFEPAYSLPNRESMTKAKDLYRLQAPPHAFSPKEEDDLQYE